MSAPQDAGRVALAACFYDVTEAELAAGAPPPTNCVKK